MTRLDGGLGVLDLNSICVSAPPATTSSNRSAAASQTAKPRSIFWAAVSRGGGAAGGGGAGGGGAGVSGRVVQATQASATSVRSVRMWATAGLAGGRFEKGAGQAILSLLAGSGTASSSTTMSVSME